MASMKAMQLVDYQHLELIECEVPAVGPSELLIRVKACGICGSDIHGYDGSTGRRRPPIIMGHEASGVVVECGSEVSHFRPGDRVAMDSTISCGECSYCQSNRINLCLNRQVLGVSCDEFRRNGAFAQYVVVPERIAYSIPESLPFEHAAMIESVSIAVHAASVSAASSKTDWAVVMGCGMIGLLVVQALKAFGVERVIAIDVDPTKLQLAKQLGAAHAVNARSNSVAAEVAEITNGKMADLALEVVGMSETIQSTIDCVRRGGRVTLVGNLSPSVDIPLQKVVNREIELRGSCASNGEIPQCIAWMSSGEIDVRPLISAVSPLDGGPKWFRDLYAGLPGTMKIILVP